MHIFKNELIFSNKKNFTSMENVLYRRNIFPISLKP